MDAHYKGFVGMFDFDEDANVFRGKVVNIQDTVTFQGDTVPQVIKEFHESVDDYLELLAEESETVIFTNSALYN